MKAKKVTRYFADCGKEYHNKAACMSHEIICKCWTNPDLRTCVTCKFGKFIKDSNGMEDDPQYLETWRQWDCKNPEWNYDTMFTQADGDNTNSLCKNCPKWEQIKHTQTVKDKKKVITSKKWYNSANYSHLLGKNVVYNDVEYQVLDVPNMLNDYYELIPVTGGKPIHVPESDFEATVKILP